MLDGTLGKITVSFEGSEFVKFASVLEENTLKIRLDADGGNYGEHEGKINISHGGIDYIVPVLIHYTEGMVEANLQHNRLDFEIDHPSEWSFAKVSITNSLDGRTQTTSATPEKPAHPNTPNLSLIHI